jgi:hypothetical protein
MTRLVAHVSARAVVGGRPVDEASEDVSRCLSAGSTGLFGMKPGAATLGHPWQHCENAIHWITTQAEENSPDAGADGCNTAQEDVWSHATAQVVSLPVPGDFGRSSLTAGRQQQRAKEPSRS